MASALMNRAASSLWLCTKRANSGCVIFIGSPPCFAIQSRRPGPASTRAISLESLLTTPVGLPAGARIPYQIGKSNPAPPASAIVGTSGKQSRAPRRGHPSGNNLPSRIEVRVIEMGAIMYVVRPSIVAARTSACVFHAIVNTVSTGW